LSGIFSRDGDKMYAGILCFHGGDSK
jgi:hypothetical protein